MADDFVQIAPDSTGAKIQTFSNTINSQNVETQAVVPVGADGVAISSSNPQPTISSIGAAGGGTLVTSTAFEASHVLKASAGTLISLRGFNNKATEQYIQIHNTTSVPSNGVTPSSFFLVPGVSNFAMDIPILGEPYTTGISVCNSSTADTKTLGSADCWFTAVVK
jgi:hypothetical protein